ncbi:MAG: hypothetical protein V1873_02580 [Verrucomicrobiota bacterium]
MSEDEVMALVVSGVLALMLWISWYWRAATVTRLASGHPQRFSLYYTPLICVGLLLLVLMNYASSDVRTSPVYILFYLVMGMAWVGLSALLFPVFGISGRDDVAERGNLAASHALGGALAGLTLSFAGGNIGNGPGWWVVVFCAALASAGLFALWWLLELFSHVSEAVTVDRDEAAGIRLAGYLIAAGLVLGRAVAGDWVSVDVTVSDFLRVARPLLVLAAVAVGVERVLKPTPEAPTRAAHVYGTPLAVAYFVAAAVYVHSLGAW